MTDTVFDAKFWDERYRQHEHAIWSGEPNQRLVEEATDLEPGSALDVGCGEGGDAIWLAERGWSVTGVDISGVALERARAAAVESHVADRIEWEQADLLDWTPRAAYYELVSVHFMHVPKAPREAIFGKLAAAVKPRGALLIVGHHPSDLETSVRRPPLPELFYTASDVAALLEPGTWDIIASDSRKRSAQDADGKTVPIHDAVLHARRRG